MATTEADLRALCMLCEYALDDATPPECMDEQEQCECEDAAVRTNDLLLARAIGRACERAILFLLGEWQAYWRIVARVQSRNAHDAEEAYAEFNAALPRVCAGFSGLRKARLTTFLEAVLRMKCYDKLRKRLNGPVEESIDDERMRGIEAFSVNTGASLECRELFHMALTTLDGELNAKERIIWRLRVDGIRQETIARIFKVSAPAISQQVMKICLKLKEILSRLAGGPDEFSDCRDYFFNEAQRFDSAEAE